MPSRDEEIAEFKRAVLAEYRRVIGELTAAHAAVRDLEPKQAALSRVVRVYGVDLN